MKKIPFNVELAKKGAKVQTANGRDVKILCYNRKSKNYPIVALVQSSNHEYEDSIVYTIDGKFIENNNSEEFDLVLLVETKTIYINMYRSYTGVFYLSQDTFKDKDTAELTGKSLPGYVKTIEIEVNDYEN